MNTAAQPIGATRTQAGTLSEKYLTFQLAGEEYGIAIMKVQEIIGIAPITHIPTLPASCRGVINLRGKLITTIDLRLKLGFDAKADSERTCIVIVESSEKTDQRHFGLIVDEVAEVLDLSPDNINPAPDYGGNLDAQFIHGIGMVNDEVKILLDVDRVLSNEAISVSEA
ncbi:MAG: purine-binding chemotaxis protein CheW [SAR324 cluster bacterium]|nr:purine-binding chemotaxis protein CheW [SAR324 cluster bacterium]